MPSRRLLCMALVFHVLILSVCHVPVGQGPFSAAYGPTAKFEALRALFVLLFLMAAAVCVSSPLGSIFSVAFGSLAWREIFAQAASDWVPANSPLRC
jgi:hypothetical protein